MADPFTWAAIGLSAAGGLMAAGSKVQQGQEARQEADSEAAQLNTNANLAQGDAQRQMLADNRKTALLQSQLQANAAASGGGASDPGVITLSEDIAAQGEYNALTDLYNGNEKAIQYQNQARAAKYQGHEAMVAGNVGAASSLLSSAGSMFSKYGNIGGGGATTATSGGAYGYGASDGINWQSPRVGGYS